MMRTLSAALALLCLGVGLGLAADWPQFMGPNRNGISPETGFNKNWGAKQPRLMWQVPMTDNGYAGPSVADGKVFIIDHQGNDDIVRAFNLETGQEVWRYTYADPGGFNYGFARSTPTYDAGKLYTYSRTAKLHCLNAADGSVLWAKDLTREYGARPPKWLHGSSPLVDGDQLVLCTGSAQGNVVALNKSTGQQIWVGGTDDVSGYAVPVLGNILGKRQYVVYNAKSAMGVDTATGQMLWSFPRTTAHDVHASQPIVEGNFVFVTSGYGTSCELWEIRPQGPAKIWQSRDISSHFSSPIFYNGYIYSTSDPGNLVCLAPQQGQTCWKQPGFQKGGLLIADGVIIALDGKDGNVIMAKADPAGYQELGRIRPLGGESWTAPILAQGRLIIRNKQALACLDLR